MRGYKIFDKNFRCMDFQYRVGKTAYIQGSPVICARGLHFCPRAIDCTNYRTLHNNRYAEVRADGDIDPIPISGFQSDKYATNALTIVREIPYEEFIKMCTGTRRTYHQGEVTSEEEMQFGNLHGRSVTWSSYRRQVSSISYYKRNVLHGTATWWHENGVKCKSIRYRMGVPEFHREWNSQGQLTLKTSYCNGRLHGEAYSVIDGVKRQFTYRHGELIRTAEGKRPPEPLPPWTVITIVLVILAILMAMGLV